MIKSPQSQSSWDKALDAIIQAALTPGVLPGSPALGAIGPLRSILRAGPTAGREAGAMSALGEDALRAALARQLPQASGLVEGLTQRIGGQAVKGMRQGGQLEAQMMRLLAEGNMTQRARREALRLMTSKLIN